MTAITLDSKSNISSIQPNVVTCTITSPDNVCRMLPFLPNLTLVELSQRHGWGRDEIWHILKGLQRYCPQLTSLSGHPQMLAKDVLDLFPNIEFIYYFFGGSGFLDAVNRHRCIRVVNVVVPHDDGAKLVVKPFVPPAQFEWLTLTLSDNSEATRNTLAQFIDRLPYNICLSLYFPGPSNFYSWISPSDNLFGSIDKNRTAFIDVCNFFAPGLDAIKDRNIWLWLKKLQVFTLWSVVTFMKSFHNANHNHPLVNIMLEKRLWVQLTGLTRARNVLQNYCSRWECEKPCQQFDNAMKNINLSKLRNFTFFQKGNK